MELFKIEEFIKVVNQNPGARYRQEILTNKQRAEDLRGVFMVLVPGGQVPYHFHNKRESIIIAISGEAIEIVEGKEIPIKANDILYIPAGEKHGVMNRTDKDFRYLEFFTCSSGVEDRIIVNG